MLICSKVRRAERKSLDDEEDVSGGDADNAVPETERAPMPSDLRVLLPRRDISPPPAAAPAPADGDAAEGEAAEGAEKAPAVRGRGAAGGLRSDAWGISVFDRLGSLY